MQRDSNCRSLENAMRVYRQRGRLNQCDRTVQELDTYRLISYPNLREFQVLYSGALFQDQESVKKSGTSKANLSSSAALT